MSLSPITDIPTEEEGGTPGWVIAIIVITLIILVTIVVVLAVWASRRRANQNAQQRAKEANLRQVEIARDRLLRQVNTQ